MGGLLTSGATENLLAMPGTRYFGATILVHEFSHAIFDAMETVDPALFEQVRKAYAQAMARHLWAGQYGAPTAHAYLAEGQQLWFTSNKIAVLDGQSLLYDADPNRRTQQ